MLCSSVLLTKQFLFVLIHSFTMKILNIFWCVKMKQNGGMFLGKKNLLKCRFKLKRTVDFGHNCHLRKGRNSVKRSALWKELQSQRSQNSILVTLT